MSQVVHLEVNDHIAMVRMEDREARNTFSKAFVQGLVDTFAAIENNNDIKVVVIHGYDNYFCCGGTKDELLDIFSGKVTFDDLRFYRLFLDCRVPVISAVQGHAIGGGLALGCYADLMVLGEECLYATNFMKYGFTPGMGATYIVPKKFGANIANELMFTANNYHGSMLKARGITLPVVKKADVIAMALELAKQLTDKPVQALQLLKAHLAHETRTILPEIIKQELEMHRLTFANPEVKKRIEELFGQ